MSKAFARFKSAHKAGQYIFRDGDLGTEMFIVQSGVVELTKEVHEVEEVIAELEKGDFFGELTVLENLPRNVSARVKEDCEVIAINGTTFDKMIKSNIEIAVRMLRKFSTRAREADSEVMRLRERCRELEQSPAAGARGSAASPASAPPATVQQEQAEIPPAPVIEPAAAPAAPVPPVETPAPAVPPVAAAATPPVAAAPSRPPTPPVQAGTGRPVLVVKGGEKTFDLASDEVTVGRADPVTGLRPDIDLTSEDVNRFISRRHARILRKDNTYYLVEEVGVTNGTYLNGKRLQAGVYSPIRIGDELCFGKVFLMFEAARS